MKKTYFFFTNKTFTDEKFDSDEAAIASLSDKLDVVEIKRGHDSAVIWKKESA